MAGPLETLLVAIGLDASKLTAGAEDAAADVEQSLSGIGAAAAGAAVGGMFVVGLDSALQSADVTTSLTNQLGLSEGEAQRAGAVAGDVYAAGFGESMADVGQAVAGVASAMGGLGKLTDSQLKEMTTGAMALAKTFEIDVADGATAAGQLINQGLVKDGREAFDVLTRAAQILPKSMVADLPAIVTEYGIHLKRIGLDAKTAFGMMSQYVAAGGRDVDQAADVLHEFGRITSEETDRAAEAFKGLGLNSKTMLADIGKGGPAAQAALGKTLDALRGIKDPAERATLQVGLFGDMAGESVGALLAMNPATAAAASGMDKAAGAAQRVAEGMEASPAQQLDSIMRTLSATLGETVAPVLSAVSQFLGENQELIKSLAPFVLALAAALAIWTVVQWALNSALLANPITWIIIGVLALVAAVVLLWQRSETFRDIVTGVWNFVWGVIKGVWNWVTQVLAPDMAATWRGIADGAKAMGRWIGDAWNWVIGLFDGDKLARAAVGLWNGIGDSFRSVINWIIRKWNSLRFGVPEFDIPGIGKVGGGTFGVPPIPLLAQGGVIPATPGGMLAVIGEGGQDEAVLPLDRLDGMLRSVAGAVRGPADGPAPTRVIIDVTGADGDLKTVIKKWVRVDGRGSTQTAFGR